MNPIAIIIIVHGLNSHSGYYQDFATRLNEEGYEVFALDLEGRGHSDGERYYTEDYNSTLSNIDQLVEIARNSYHSIPIFLYGHSAGGVFASLYAARNQQKISGLISASFAFQIPAPAFILWLFKILAKVIPHKRLVKLRNADFSRDKAFVLRMNEDLLLDKEVQPAKTIQQLLLAGDALRQAMPNFKIPLLIIHGTADQATVPAGSEYFMAHAGSEDKSIHLYEGYFHDLLHDKYNGIIIKDIFGWLSHIVNKP